VVFFLYKGLHKRLLKSRCYEGNKPPSQKNEEKIFHVSKMYKMMTKKQYTTLILCLLDDCHCFLSF